MKISDIITGGKVTNANVKTFAKPFSGMVVIFILFAVLMNVGISKLKSQMNELKNLKQLEEELSVKFSKLSEENNFALENTNKLVIALPQKNSVMIMISQIKRLATEKNVKIGKLEVSGFRSENNMNSIQLRIQIDASDINSFMDYLNEIPKVAPVSSIFDVKISSLVSNSFIGIMELTVYWADFPTTIPGVREPITTLSESEEKALEVLSKLREPEYQILEPSIQPDRVEPFN